MTLSFSGVLPSRPSDDTARREAYFSLGVTAWRPTIDPAVQAELAAALEQGKVICLPALAFPLEPGESTLLRPDCVRPGTKTVKYSLAGHAMWGSADGAPALAGLMRRYAESARDLVGAMLPGYAPFLAVGNTSFRPVEAHERVQSRRHDDRLLHVDAFPSRPSHGARILRLFTNIHPGDCPRIWRVGEPFAAVASRFLPTLPRPLPGSAALLRLLKITKGTRSPYDHYMLRLHDRMKLDDAYQRSVAATEIAFPPGSSWIAFTDQVSHAVVSGQHALEQTFALPATTMTNPAGTPLRILESLTGRQLT